VISIISIQLQRGLVVVPRRSMLRRQTTDNISITCSPAPRDADLTSDDAKLTSLLSDKVNQLIIRRLQLPISNFRIQQLRISVTVS
jgi:hypothetical protein